MKRAQCIVESISLWCPYCGSFYECPKTGSSLLTSDSGVDVAELTCATCGKAFQTPTVVYKLNQRGW